MEKTQPTDIFCQIGQIPPATYRVKPAGLLGSMDFLSQTGGSPDPYEHHALASVRELNRQVENLRKESEDLKKMIAELLERPNVIPSKIYSLPDEKYQLSCPVDVIVKIYRDEVVAVMPDLELYGEGANEMEAMADLKDELIDLCDDLSDMTDETLGDKPKEWKRILKVLITKCE